MIYVILIRQQAYLALSRVKSLSLKLLDLDDLVEVEGALDRDMLKQVLGLGHPDGAA